MEKKPDLAERVVKEISNEALKGGDRDLNKASNEYEAKGSFDREFVRAEEVWRRLRSGDHTKSQLIMWSRDLNHLIRLHVVESEKASVNILFEMRSDKDQLVRMAAINQLKERL